MSENIESVLHEDRVFQPPQDFVAEARLNAEKLAALHREAAEDYEGFWARQAREEISWEKPFGVTLDESNAPHYQWFSDGRLNVSYNCLDRHLAERGDKTAIIFEGEPGDVRKYTYRELHAEVCQFANALKAQGIRKGDRVVVYMPMIAEAVIAMQACARIGATHSVVFGGFSAEALRDRVNDAGARMIITADGGHRSGKIIPLKTAVDEAIAHGTPSVEKVIVFERTRHGVPLVEGRDVLWDDALAGQPTTCEPEWVEAEHPLFLLYTSGSTGKPKGIQHSSAGYLLHAILTNKWVFDLHDRDVFWCTADVGWITGHTYVAYGPLALGATQVIYEGAPTVPDGGRFWKLAAEHAVTVFYTAPTAIRALMKLGDAFPQSYDLSKLRLLGTVGEPINPEAWMWYHRVIGGERCPIADTWWQTETGGHMIAPIPGAVATKPGSCTLALPGIMADVVDEHGESIAEPNRGGYLVIRKPWPSMLRTVWGDDERYRKTYWGMFDGRFYLAGDSARRDADGYFWIMGRVDDVLNVSGHRLGTMEIESALVSHEAVAEAAVVGRPHEIKGEAIVAYVILRGERPTGASAEAMAKTLRDWVAKEIGPIAKPDEIRFTEGLPKTRSGKIMRRLLRTIAKGEDITSDISTLENEAVIAQLQGKA
ncbi:acetate--CoA ligase [Acidihalobacter aeolianus]|uniref:Acetyl-coenzyme A synthetase n=1 Tax=Acidihalobacter aeolianus TaxID=2792603 RepID=A0A1D8K843_9GAMM|nr:acetate--CoA ligase [Acidihalobacter aeolianus]AOV17145.1 acetate--CoA ligase [Acidihalobacter aeolianus]